MMSDLQKTSDALQQEMKLKLASIDLSNDDLTVVAGAVRTLREIIARLRSFVVGYNFIDQNEEILFFKQVKPVFLSQYYYHSRIFSLRVAGMFKPENIRMHVFESELDRLSHLIQKNRRFYNYCISNAAHLDTIYFLRIDPNIDPINTDPRFCSSHDRKLAQFVAAELIREFIGKQLDAASSTAAASSKLKWTATKTDLTELIYALQAAEVFNNGDTDIKQIAETFEAICNIDLGDYYRTFQSIQVRKNNQSAFLSKLKDKLHLKLDDLG